MYKLDIIRSKAKKLGLLGQIVNSNLKTKKYTWISPDGKKTHFGAKFPYQQDYLDHKDEKRRENYRKRHSGIKLKNGKRAIDVKGSPAWLSYYLLW